MREKVRFPNFAVIFQHRDGSLDQQAKFISNRHNNLKGKKCYFITNLGIFRIIAISSLSYLSILLSLLFFYL